MDKYLKTCYSQLYIGFLSGCYYLLKLFSFKNNKLRDQLNGRTFSSERVIEMASTFRHCKKKVIFYCSSAGELEQALPLITALKRDGFVSIAFIFSKSGIDYLTSKTSDRAFDFHFFLCPIDNPRVWSHIFSAVQPQFSIVVRHEIWPGFLWIAKQWGEVYLVNATQRQFHGLLNKFLLKHFTKIFTVEPTSQSSLQVIVAGDTKYERALERAKAESLNSTFPRFFKNTGIFGSVYAEDLLIIGDLLKRDRGGDWGYVIFPHELNNLSIANWVDFFKLHNVPYKMFSEIDGAKIDNERVVLVDKQGLLAEGYAAGEFAYVGGAVHHRVHNVLEPLVYQIPVFFGSHFQSSPEAVAAVDAKVAFPVKSSVEFERDLSKVLMDSGTKENIRQFLAQRCDASKKILEHINLKQ